MLQYPMKTNLPSGYVVEISNVVIAMHGNRYTLFRDALTEH